MLRHVLVVGFSHYFNGDNSNPFQFNDKKCPSYRIHKADIITTALTTAQQENIDLIITNYDLTASRSTKTVTFADVTANGLTLLMNLYNLDKPKLLVTTSINPLLAQKAIRDFGASGIYEFPIRDHEEFGVICNELIESKESPRLRTYYKVSPHLHEPDLKGIAFSKFPPFKYS